MPLKISPKTRYLISRILPYGIIWLVIGWFILAIEALVPSDPAHMPRTDIALDARVFLFASVAVLDAGLLMGTVEVLWLGKRFRSMSFGRKILYKMGFYLLFIFLIMSFAYPLAAAIESGLSPLDARVWQRFGEFLWSTTALSTLVGLSASIFASLLYAGVSEHLGHKVLMNFFRGKYHHPREEVRVFMFLDLSGSTGLAEQLGHQRYFEFLSEFYNDLSDTIIIHRGEVYQYVGDEIVISWRSEAGLRDAACIRCFYAIQKNLAERASRYLEKYGVAPAFRAAIHLGPVTTGEIGALKKDIFFTGDVLNVTSRLQALCKDYGEALLISGTLAEALDKRNPPGTLPYSWAPLGEADLRGRSEPVEVMAVRPASLAGRSEELL